MPFPVRPEWSTASVGSSHAPTDAVDHSAPSAIRPESTYISGKVVQTNGATSKLFCPWHGKVKSPQYRIHFSWPTTATTPIYIVYVGPKLTKK